MTYTVQFKNGKDWDTLLATRSTEWRGTRDEAIDTVNTIRGSYRQKFRIKQVPS